MRSTRHVAAAALSRSAEMGSAHDRVAALSMLPALAFFVLAQRRIVSGLSGLSGSLIG
jgi:ABC-type glycerol-3-phosphate transport system permease component